MPEFEVLVDPLIHLRAGHVVVVVAEMFPADELHVVLGTGEFVEINQLGKTLVGQLAGLVIGAVHDLRLRGEQGR